MPCARAQAHHRRGQLAGRAPGRHEGALAHLDVEHQPLAPDAIFFDMMLRGDQRDAGHGGGDVAQRVHAPSAGARSAVWPATAIPTSAHLVDQPAGAGDAEARDRLQLVERAAGVAQAAARHLAPARRRRQPAARRRASSCRRPRRWSACRRPAGRRRQVEPRRPSRPSPRSRSAVSARSCRAARPPSGTPPAGSRASSAPRSRAASSAAVSSPPSRLRAIRSTMRRRHSTGVPGRPRSSPRRSAGAAPSRRRRRRCRRRGGGRCSGAPGTCASSSACSREWSVDAVVGSQPWSEVSTSRSPWCSAASSSRQLGVELLAARRRSPRGRCGGPRACRSRPG